MCFLLLQANPQKARIKNPHSNTWWKRKKKVHIVNLLVRTHKHLWTYAGLYRLIHLNHSAVNLRGFVWRLCAALAPTPRGEMWHWRIWRSTWLFSQPRTKPGQATNNLEWNAALRLSVERNTCVHTCVWVTVREDLMSCKAKIQLSHFMSQKKHWPTCIGLNSVPYFQYVSFWGNEHDGHKISWVATFCANPGNPLTITPLSGTRFLFWQSTMHRGNRKMNNWEQFKGTPQMKRKTHERGQFSREDGRGTKCWYCQSKYWGFKRWGVLL